MPFSFKRREKGRKSEIRHEAGVYGGPASWAVTGAFLNKKLARVFMRFLSCFPPRFVLVSILIVGFVVYHGCGFFLVFSPIFKK